MEIPQHVNTVRTHAYMLPLIIHILAHICFNMFGSLWCLALYVPVMYIYVRRHTFIDCARGPLLVFPCDMSVHFKHFTLAPMREQERQYYAAVLP